MKKINLAILKELLNKSQDKNIKDFIAIMYPKPEKKPLKEFIKNANKKNKLTKDILVALYKQDGLKAHHWPK